MGSPITVPTLDELAQNPARATELPLRALAALASRCASAQSAIAAAQLANVANGADAYDASPTDDDRMLLPTEAAVLLRRKVRWVYRNAAKLPFIKRVGPRSLLCSEEGIRRWLARRKG
jgi:hypothetical protein